MIFILLPAYNESGNIEPLLHSIAEEAELWAKRRGEPMPVHAVVVNDGSTDDTHEKAASFSGSIQVTVLDHAQNAGLGAALRTGIDFALTHGGNRDFAITLDADGTHHPRYIFQIVDRLEQGADIVIASRYVAGGKEYGVSGFRKILSHGARTTYHWFLPNIPIQDFSCGFRGFSLSILKATVNCWGERLFEAPGFACTGELMLKALAHTTPDKVTEIPFELHYEAKKGDSKMPTFRTILGTLALLTRARKWLKTSGQVPSPSGRGLG